MATLRMTMRLAKAIWCALVLAPITLTFASSQIDSVPSTTQTFRITSEIDNIFINFIQATNQDGESLFEKIGSDLDGEYEFEVNNGDQIDITYGRENALFFSLVTFKDIQSGFVLKQDFFQCPFDPPMDNEYIDVTIEVNGIVEYDYLHLPFGNKKIKVSEKGKKLNLSGQMMTNRLYQITIQEKEGPHKLFVLNKDQFAHIEDNKYILSIDIDDFSLSRDYEVEMPHDGNWQTSIQTYSPTGQRTTIANWAGASGFEFKKHFNFFTLREEQIDMIRLNTFASSRSEGYKFNKIMNTIHEKIEGYNPYFELKDITKNHYEVHIDGVGNLFESRYIYKNDNFRYTWYIYQKADDVIQGNLPHPPEGYLKNAPLTRKVLGHPVKYEGQLYQINDESLDEIYNLMSINKILHCMDYSSYYKSKKL